MEPYDSPLMLKVPYSSPKNPFLHSLLRTSQFRKFRVKESLGVQRVSGFRMDVCWPKPLATSLNLKVRPTLKPALS